LLAGHKGAAVKCFRSFRPVEARADLALQERGRVRVRLDGVAFESTIVPRSKRFWLLVDSKVLSQVGRTVGDQLVITVEPSNG
jgi:hypothetical protein